MQISDLRPIEGSKKNRKRVGRGNAAGGGTTAGRGTKGQLSRSGGGKGVGFEGGQNPLAMRLPKLPGFKPRHRTVYTVINLARLNDAFSDGDTVDNAALKQKGFIKSERESVKILGDGDITKKLTVQVARVSQQAQKKLEASGGKVQ